MGKIKKRTFKNQRNEFENDSFIRKETKPRVTKPTGKLFYFFFQNLSFYHFRNFFFIFLARFFREAFENYRIYYFNLFKTLFLVQQEIKKLRKLDSIACRGLIRAKEQPITGSF